MYKVASESKSSPVTCCDSYAIMQINTTFHENLKLIYIYINTSSYEEKVFSLHFHQIFIRLGIYYKQLFELCMTISIIYYLYIANKTIKTYLSKINLFKIIYIYRISRYSDTKSMPLFIFVFHFQFTKHSPICIENRISYKHSF